MTSGRQHLMTSCPQAFTVTAPDLRKAEQLEYTCAGSLLQLLLLLTCVKVQPGLGCCSHP